MKRKSRCFALRHCISLDRHVLGTGYAALQDKIFLRSLRIGFQSTQSLLGSEPVVSSLNLKAYAEERLAMNRIRNGNQ